MTIYECALHSKIGSNDFYNVIHYDITGDTPLDLQDLVDQIAASWVTNIKSVIVPAMAFEGIVFRLDIDGSIGTEITPSGGPEAGGAADNQWIGQTAVLVQKRTNGLVRPTLGRAFQPGVTTEGANSSGEWTVNVLTAVEAFWDDLIIMPFAGNGQAEMMIKASNPAAPNTNAYNSVAECVALPIPSTLQSRKKGRGA